ncbi:MAG: TerD family protein [Alphaproteobacteria bacterium PRO2]|nr:TerD family protein [Alphaproteobacteria bacterium PRO2]
MADILDTEYEGKEIELTDGKARVGDDINLTVKDPTLHKLLVGVGWDLNVFNADALDLDVSLFMLDKTGKTRVDEDFVFYNQPVTLEGGVRHGGDSRTGAGDGDDEVLLIDLHSVPFDIMKIVFTLTIYRGREKQQNMGMVRNAYIRIANEKSNVELVRYEFSEDLEDKMETGMIVATLNREGPKWHFTPVAEFVAEGLKDLGPRYGLTIVQQ